MFRSDATVVFVITGSSVSVVSTLRPLDDAAELSESPRRSKLFSLLDGIKLIRQKNIYFHCRKFLNKQEILCTKNHVIILFVHLDIKNISYTTF